jgi:hypothetical protein
MTETITTKLGKTRAGERSRIWLEGKRLNAHGFTHRTPFHKTWSAGRLVIEAATAEGVEGLPRDARGTVAGAGERPVIDITGALVAKVFGGTHVRVTFSHRRIVIVEA